MPPVIAKGACDGLDLVEKCEDSERICEAEFDTGGASCYSHCQSLGLRCEDAWNDGSGTCNKQAYSSNACDVHKQGQICRCMKGS